MSAEFRVLVELALQAPITNPKLIMSCVDDDRILGDLHEWSDDVDSLVKAFEEQGDCLLGLRSDSEIDSKPIGSGMISWGAFMCLDQGEDLIIDYTDNKVMDEIYNAWSEQVQSI